MTAGGEGAGGSGTGQPVPAPAGSDAAAEPGTKRSRLILGAAVAGTLVAGVIAGSLLLNLPRATISESPGTATASAAASASPSPSVTSEPAPSVASTPTPAPTPTPLPAGAAPMTWTAGTRFDGGTAVVERIGDRWFVGGALSVNGASQAAVWSSSDAQTWEGPVLLSPIPPPKPADHPGDEPWFPDRYAISGFGAWQDSIIAVGRYQFGCCDGLLPMLWRSEDGGGTWSHVATEGTAFHTGQLPMDVTTTPRGELAVFSITGLGGGASTFMTSDLATWTEHPVAAIVGPSSFGGFAVTPNAMVLVGFHVEPYSDIDDRQAEQRAWSSTDGRTWSPMTPPDDEGELAGVVWDAVRHRLVVVGSDKTGAPRVWLGDDGGGWVSSPLSEDLGGIVDLAVTDGLLVAVGSLQASAESDLRSTIWTSHDGVTWSVVEPAAPLALPISVAVSGDTAVLLVGAQDGTSSTLVGRTAE